MGLVHYAIEDDERGRSLVVTGLWDPLISDRLRRGDVTWLVLDRSRGFAEKSLWFLEPWPIYGVRLVDATQTDLTPLYRLGATLGALEVQAAPGATLDLAEFHELERAEIE